MSPNMALLVDTTQYSSLNELGSMLFNKCFNNDSEVRNAALTVVHTICQKVNKGNILRTLICNITVILQVDSIVYSVVPGIFVQYIGFVCI